MRYEGKSSTTKQRRIHDHLKNSKIRNLVGQRLKIGRMEFAVGIESIHVNRKMWHHGKLP